VSSLEGLPAAQPRPLGPLSPATNLPISSGVSFTYAPSSPATPYGAGTP
jgi:hypothetical protein